MLKKRTILLKIEAVVMKRDEKYENCCSFFQREKSQSTYCAPKRSCKLNSLAGSKSLINASPLMKYLQSKTLALMRFCMINYQH